MSLEEDVVIQRMNQEGSDSKDMVAFVEGLRTVGLEVDIEKVNTAIKRYNLIRKVDINPKEKKKLIQNRFNEICKKYIEKERENPSIIDVKIRMTDRESWERYENESCNSCHTESCDYYEIEITKIKQEAEILTRITENSASSGILFKYCNNCGHLEKNKSPDARFRRVWEFGELKEVSKIKITKSD
jgi:hypothetical protein